jgi:acyl-CoA reductase-like NAD-dependent aldehyde dehydrogenase
MAARSAAWGISSSRRCWPTRGLRCRSSGIDAGIIEVNGGELGALSFGGFKQSGIGQELGRAGVEAYTETKAVGIKF